MSVENASAVEVNEKVKKITPYSRQWHFLLQDSGGVGSVFCIREKM